MVTAKFKFRRLRFYVQIASKSLQNEKKKKGTKKMNFVEVWRVLRKHGWASARASGLAEGFDYIKPNVTRKHESKELIISMEKRL